MSILRIPLIVLLTAIPLTASSTTMARQAAEGLIQRVVLADASHFLVEIIPPDRGRDVFEIETRGSQIVLRGNNGVSVASALNHYLKYECRREISWNAGEPPVLPHPLPLVPHRIRVVSSLPKRVDLNYCAFSYTAAWWDWDQWQHQIDWMAMHGVNMPLAITGQEAVWQATLRHFRMNDDEIRMFLSGPAFFAWQWMANLEGWGGPLPQSWIDSHIQLARRILQRERELGMQPILQGFTGFVPRLLKAKYPDARIQFKPNWCNVFPGTAQLDPLDPLFPELGKTFLREEIRLLGTDHVYAADPFHESAPPSKAPGYLPAVAKQILDTMKAVDPQAVIAMQTWSLRKPIVTNIPNDRILLLALTGTGWQKTEGFWGRPWIVGVLQNYGGRVFLAGSLPRALTAALNGRTNAAEGNLVGVGMFPEGIHQNPVFYDAASEIAWMPAAPDPAKWLHNEMEGRYGQSAPAADEAWQLLLGSLYSDGAEQGSLESPICSRPALFLDRAAPNANFARHYDPALPWHAWAKLQSASKSLAGVDAYRYDLTDLARQCLADLSITLQRDISAAYLRGDKAQFAAASARFLDLASDLDTLVGTRREFLLGNWINSAKRWASNDAERRQYEWNARLLVTVWGPRAPNAFLFDYSNRQWSGLIRNFYIPRWRMFLDYLKSQPAGAGRFTGEGLSLEYNRPADNANSFYKNLSEWEYDWTRDTSEFAGTPRGDSVKIAAELLRKWNPVREAEYKRYDLQKPESVPRPNSARPLL